MDDLDKEYSAIFPGLSLFTSSFSNMNPEMALGEASHIIQTILNKDTYEPRIQQQLAILQNPTDVLRNLYRIGFIGIMDENSGNFVFCHDGRDPNKEFEKTGKILIHPCYWMALNSTRNGLDPTEAEEIYDEYDIEIASETPEQRAKLIGGIMNELNHIPEGMEGARNFESWCLHALKIIFAGVLRNIELHPNKPATQRRDIIATNHGGSSAWKRILSDYGARQVIFEVKNHRDLGPDEYRQMNSYLTGEYGRLGFIITRDDKPDITNGKELDWMREMYYSHHKLIIKLTGKYLSNLLSKLRNPQKHDAPDKAINDLLDRYIRLYLGKK